MRPVKHTDPCYKTSACSECRGTSFIWIINNTMKNGLSEILDNPFSRKLDFLSVTRTRPSRVLSLSIYHTHSYPPVAGKESVFISFGREGWNCPVCLSQRRIIGGSSRTNYPLCLRISLVFFLSAFIFSSTSAIIKILWVSSNSQCFIIFSW